MKRVSYALVMALALVAVLSTTALADCGSCGDEKHHAEKAKTADNAKMGECCIKAAQAGEGCCGKSADEVKVAFAAHKANCAATCSAADQAKCTATEAAMADMHKCCATALKAGKGCCGKDADALKASFDEKVVYQTAATAAKADMDKCCAASLEAGKGCCGKDADALKASYEEKVKAQEKKMASAEKASL